MIRIFLHLILLLLGVQSASTVLAQSCCSGGVPTSSNLGLIPQLEGSVLVSVGADFNTLRTLKSGTLTLDDDLRNRSTQTYLTRTSYSISPTTHVEVLVPYIIQSRSIVTNSGRTAQEQTAGFGDVTLLATHRWLDKVLVMRSGVGLTLPTGDFNQTDDRGLFFLEDLQPGSGAIDMILFHSTEFQFFEKNPNRYFFLNSILTRSGKNSQSRGGAQEYQFGNEVQVIVGYSDQVLLAKSIVTPTLSLRYRHVGRDLVDGIPNSGSGGDFLFSRIGANLQLSPVWSAYGGYELPVYSRVNETQLAPSYRISIGITISISKNQNASISQF
ncbi:MAG: hypothetical protein AAFQ02_07705 [Bacteroidota bacterium]